MTFAPLGRTTVTIPQRSVTVKSSRIPNRSRSRIGAGGDPNPSDRPGLLHGGYPPTAVLARQLLAVIAQFEKTSLDGEGPQDGRRPGSGGPKDLRRDPTRGRRVREGATCPGRVAAEDLRWLALQGPRGRPYIATAVQSMPR